MPRKSKKQRSAEQVARQQRVRDAAKARRRPSRDDLARVLLWKMITAAQRRKDAMPLKSANRSGASDFSSRALFVRRLRSSMIALGCTFSWM